MPGESLSVVALGGNALLPRSEKPEAATQALAARRAAVALAAVSETTRLVVTHGNGPQVGLPLPDGDGRDHGQFTSIASGPKMVPDGVSSSRASALRCRTVTPVLGSSAPRPSSSLFAQELRAAPRSPR